MECGEKHVVGRQRVGWLTIRAPADYQGASWRQGFFSGRSRPHTAAQESASSGQKGIVEMEGFTFLRKKRFVRG